jgi:hypothetical protein
MRGLMNSDNILEMSIVELKEIKCVRCQSDRLLGGAIKRRRENGIDYFEQKLKCRDCWHEMIFQVRI